MRKSISPGSVLAVLMATPSPAQTAEQPSAAIAAPAEAPRKQAMSGGDIICQRVPVVGSRLTKKKVCMTRSQWADQQIQDRQAIEQNQIKVGSKDN